MSGLRSRVISAMLLLITAMLVGACTVLSGVDELEVRKVPADAGSTENGGGANDGGPPSGGDGSTPGGECGAQGKWSACELPADTSATCASRCAAKGLTCVESCCAYDADGVNFVAKAGLVYATGLTCELSSVPYNSYNNTCTALVDFILTTTFDIRCCCR